MATLTDSVQETLVSVDLTADSRPSDYRCYRDLPHRSFNETLRTHSNYTVKLSEIGEHVSFSSKVCV